MLNFFRLRPFRKSGIIVSLFVALCIPFSGCSNSEKDNPAKVDPKNTAKPAVKDGSKSTALDAGVTLALPKIALPWQNDLSAALSQAEKEKKYLFIDFTAEWCKACKELESTTFRDPAVAALLKSSFVLVKLDVTQQSEADKALMTEFGVQNLPALLATQQKAVYLQINRLVGPKDLENHLAKLPPISGKIATP